LSNFCLKVNQTIIDDDDCDVYLNDQVWTRHQTFKYNWSMVLHMERKHVLNNL